MLKGSVGVIHLELDFEPALAKSEQCSTVLVKNQQDLEKKDLALVPSEMY